MKTRKELKKIIKKEEERKARIFAFLKEHKGQYFTSDEVIEEVGIKCAGRLLDQISDLEKDVKKVELQTKWYQDKEYLEYFDGIEEIVIPDPDDLDSKWCGRISYYGYRNTAPKNLDEIRKSRK